VLYFTHCDRPLYYFFILEYSETQWSKKKRST
jgi:hypothetical protein